MIIPDIQEKDEGAWFDLKGGGRVELRLLSRKDVKEMRDSCIKTNIEYPLLDGKYQRFEGTAFNSDLWEEMQWDKTIMDWEGIFDSKEHPVECTKENKILLMENVPDFVEAYQAGMKALKDAETQKAEELEKNS